MTQTKAPPLTAVQERQLHGIAKGLLNEMASDVLEMLAEEGKYEIPRAEVIEMIGDAGRLLQEAERRAPELAEWLRVASWKELSRELGKVFPYASYC